MWGEWLVFGTALGVGDNVAKAMKGLNIPGSRRPTIAPALFIGFVPIVAFFPALPWRHGVVWAGADTTAAEGFGGHGGFGGGGAGGR